jgi:ABC-type phosphate transport system substrate-binding protein
MTYSKQIIKGVMAMTFALLADAGSAEVVVVVSSKNPITAISNNQAADIFLGKTNRFPDGSKAQPVDQIEGARVRDEFYKELAEKSPAQIRAHWSKLIFTGKGQPPKEMPNSAAVKKALARDRSVIGYIDSSEVDDSVRVLLVLP